MKAPQHILSRLIILLLLANISAYAMDQPHQQTVKITHIPPWAPYAKTFCECLKTFSPQSSLPLDITSLTAPAIKKKAHKMLKQFYKHNPVGYQFLDRCFSHPEQEFVSYLHAEKLKTLYSGLDFALLIDVQEPFITRLASYVGQQLYEMFKTDAHKICKFLNKTTTNKDLTNRRILQSMPEIQPFFVAHTTPIIVYHDAVRSAQFNHTTTRILITSDTNVVHLWDASTGALLRTFSQHTDRVTSAQFNHISTRIVTTSRDKTARVWDATTGALIHTLAQHTDTVTSAQFNHDSTRIVTTSHDNTSSIWDAITGTVIHTLSGHHGYVNAAQFNHDGTELVTASHDHTLRIWNVETGTLVRTFPPHASRIASVCFNHDSTRLVTTSYDQVAHIWDIATEKVLHTLSGHTSWLTSAQFSHDGTCIVTSSYDKTARIWDGTTGALLHTLTHYTNWVSSARFSHDDTNLITTAHDHMINIWRVKPPPCTLAQALLIKLIMHEYAYWRHTAPGASPEDHATLQEQRALDLGAPEHSSCLAIFNTLDPAWQATLSPFLLLPLPTRALNTYKPHKFLKSSMLDLSDQEAPIHVTSSSCSPVR